MKREKLNLLAEKDLLVAMIVSDKFCREIIPVMKPELLASNYARIVAGWVSEYYLKYKVPPQKDILKLYRAKCGDIPDDTLRENILSFVEATLKNYDDRSSFNADFMIQRSVEYLKTRSLKALAEDIDAQVSIGDIAKAENLVLKYRAMEKQSGRTISLFHDTEAVVSAFTDNDDKLLTLPGAYGKIIGAIGREDFISILAPMKRGKTWALIDVCVRAAQLGFKVLFVSLEMSEKQIVHRFWCNLSGQLLDEGKVEYPIFTRESDSDLWSLERKKLTPAIIDVTEIRKKQKSFTRMFRGGNIEILSVPAYSLTVKGLEMDIERLFQERGFSPDLIAIDYADIMSPTDRSEYRNQLDTIWKGLRGLAQKLKAPILTASQSTRATIEKDVRSDTIAEDIRKLAHITSMIGINQTPQERKMGIVRLRQLAIRGEEVEYREAVCTQCLSLGRFVMDSRFMNEVDLAGYLSPNKSNKE